MVGIEKHAMRAVGREVECAVGRGGGAPPAREEGMRERRGGYWVVAYQQLRKRGWVEAEM